MVFLWSPLTMHTSAMEPRKELRRVPMAAWLVAGGFGGRSVVRSRARDELLLQYDVAAAAEGNQKAPSQEERIMDSSLAHTTQLTVKNGPSVRLIQ